MLLEANHDEELRVVTAGRMRAGWSDAAVCAHRDAQ